MTDLLIPKGKKAQGRSVDSHMALFSRQHEEISVDRGCFPCFPALQIDDRSILYEKSLDLLLREDQTGLQGLQECDFMCFGRFCFCVFGAEVTTYRYVLSENSKFSVCLKDSKELHSSKQHSGGQVFVTFYIPTSAVTTTYGYGADNMADDYMTVMVQTTC
ncbi:unnamed protein product [Calypogeia fissa]